MATWRAIANSEVDPNSPITTALAQAWRDNPIAIAEGATGAPRIKHGALDIGAIGQSEIASGAVGQAELKSTTGEVSLTSFDGTAVTDRLTLPGGEYGFAPQGRVNRTDSFAGAAEGAIYALSHTEFDTGGAGGLTFSRDNADWSTSFRTSVMLSVQNDGGNSVTLYVQQRYIQASPPYDLGDGECGLFVEANVLPNGQVVGLYIGADPVWANNGPTNIRPDFVDTQTRKKYKRIRRPQLCRADLESGVCDMAEYIAAQKEAPVEDVEVTHALKNADMDTIPHSWSSKPQGTICLLDPVNTHDLLALHDAGENVSDLIYNGYIQIGNKVKRKGPPGVKTMGFKWSNKR